MTKATRGKGEGSVYQRRDGYWVGSIEAGRYPNGRRRRLRVVRKAKADVIAGMRDLRRTQGAAVPTSRWTVDSYLAFWLADVIKGDVSAETLRDYAKRVDRIVATIGTVKLGNLTKAHVQALANRLTEQYAPRTRNSTLALARQALRWAVPELIPHSPAEGVQGPKARAADVDDALGEAEARAVEEAARGEPLEALVWLALNYGMRLGELRGMNVTDVDLTGEELTVRRSTTKTDAGHRTLPLIPEAKEQLRRHLAKATVRPLDGPLFAQPHGPAVTPHQVAEAWNRALRVAGVSHLCRRCATDARCHSTVRRFHSSRHTAATLLLSKGVELEVVTAILGHAHIGITASMYAKVRADLKRKGLNKLG